MPRHTIYRLVFPNGRHLTWQEAGTFYPLGADDLPFLANDYKAAMSIKEMVERMYAKAGLPDPGLSFMIENRLRDDLFLHNG